MAKMGRPKRSRDVEYQCQLCGKQYTLPEWQTYGTLYCSRACYAAGKIGKGGQRRAPRSKACRTCGGQFDVPGLARFTRAKYCSTQCAGVGGRERIARTLSETEAAWLAGVFDGEGSVVFLRRGKAAEPSSIRVIVPNTCRPLIERIATVTGCGSFLSRGKPVNPKHNECWTWQAHGQNAARLLTQMLPWLIVKKEKALRAIVLVGTTITLPT